MKIIIDGYPCTLEFETKRVLPAFKSGCKTRCSVAHHHLRKSNYDAHHAPEDFVVEVVEVIPGGEIWHLGS